MIISRSRWTHDRPHDPAALCEVFAFTLLHARSAPLRRTQRQSIALPAAHRTLVRANEYPCDRRRLSPTRLHPQS